MSTEQSSLSSFKCKAWSLGKGRFEPNLWKTPVEFNRKKLLQILKAYWEYMFPWKGFGGFSLVSLKSVLTYFCGSSWIHTYYISLDFSMQTCKLKPQKIFSCALHPPEQTHHILPDSSKVWRGSLLRSASQLQQAERQHNLGEGKESQLLGENPVFTAFSLLSFAAQH